MESTLSSFLSLTFILTSLSSSFNLNGMTLVKTQTNFGGNELRDLDAFAQALGFSSDGSKMFYFGNFGDGFNRPEKMVNF